MVAINELIRSLNRRREQLGMTLGALAERSGFSLPTVQRILAGDQPRVSLPSVLALADALEMRLDLKPRSDAEELLDREARRKAERLVGMVQGSAALEGQGLDEATRERMIQRTVHELRAGSKRRIWAA
ncbi:MAG: helix-turn-helix domain-containing protein [Planctomycetota bacterium]|jgi:transcriptional regulator with XRE-family HTH domain